ncbi:hypothetical protein ACRQ5B_12305 [Pseudarthrobacter sp. L19]|uniref:hypothetical protein n=1 Tax=Pseudarthrobacter sp. L19 TaxID=3423951 RepID=UPI003D7AD96C
MAVGVANVTAGLGTAGVVLKGSECPAAGTESGLASWLALAGPPETDPLPPPVVPTPKAKYPSHTSTRPMMQADSMSRSATGDGFFLS